MLHVGDMTIYPIVRLNQDRLCSNSLILVSTDMWCSLKMDLYFMVMESEAC